MSVEITGLIADSAGQVESGRIDFAQAQRIDTGEFLVTQSIATAQVVSGRLRALDGSPFVLPVNPEGTAVRVREILGGRTFEWWTAVPDVAQVEYRELPVVESTSAPTSVFGPPPWLVRVEALRDETVQAIADGTAVAESLGGLAGINQAVADANTSAQAAGASASQAAGSASTASGEADRAEAAASSIDMTAINERLDGVDDDLDTKATTAYVDAKVAAIPPPDLTRPDMVSTLRYPVYIAHRGSQLCYPEHSIEAYRASVAGGFIPETDVRALADGTLVCVHDATTNRTMTVNRTVASMTVAEWRKARIKPPVNGSRIYGTGYGTPVLFEDYLDEFGGRILLWPEIKEAGTAPAVIQAVVNRRLQRAVVLSSFDMNVCRQIVAAGCYAMALTDTVSPATLAADGIHSVGVSGAATNAYVTSCKAAGLKVFSWTHNTKVASDAELARGCDGVITDDPWETSRLAAPRTHLDLANGFLPPGSAHNRGWDSGSPGTTQFVYVEDGTLRFDNAETTGRANSIKLGSLGYGGPSLKLRLWAQSYAPVQTATPESAWLVGVYLGKQVGDEAVNERPGDFMCRLAMVRRDGRKHIYNVPNFGASATQLGSTAATTPPYAPVGGRGEPHLLEFEFTPTQTVIRNLTRNDPDLTVTHAAWTGDDLYLTINVLGAVGRVWGIHVAR